MGEISKFCHNLFPLLLRNSPLQKKKLFLVAYFCIFISNGDSLLAYLLLLIKKLRDHSTGHLVKLKCTFLYKNTIFLNWS